MKNAFQVLTLVAFAATALPALADTTNAMNTNLDPKTMTCADFIALGTAGKTAQDQTTVAMMVKTAMADDAAVKAMSDADMTAEVLKRCGAHTDAMVLDAFKM